MPANSLGHYLQLRGTVPSARSPSLRSISGVVQSRTCWPPDAPRRKPPAAFGSQLTHPSCNEGGAKVGMLCGGKLTHRDMGEWYSIPCINLLSIALVLGYRSLAAWYRDRSGLGEVLRASESRSLRIGSGAAEFASICDRGPIPQLASPLVLWLFLF